MKLTAILIIAVLINARSKSYSQNLTLRAEGITLERVMRVIEKQTGYHFFYDKEDVASAGLITIDVENVPLKEALDKCFANQPLTYKIINKTIVIRRKEISGMDITPVQFRVEGTVTDKQGDTLPGVSVKVKDAALGAITDESGRYSIMIPDAIATLVFTYIGFARQEVAVASRFVINVALASDVQRLEEVVVVGYGTQRKSDITGAISSISSKALSETPAPNLLELAQGRMAGVDIVRSDGSPGAPMQIRIRGNRSINASNEPLYVIDGIPTSANINNFNPADIASMEVLKDASAVAIYGSRGANGVVLITTKRGTKGKPVISYDGYYGVKKPVENIDLMNGTEFAQYVRIAHGMSPDDDSRDALIMSNEEAGNFQKGISTDWLDLILATGTQQNHNIAASGGTDKVTYYLSGSYYNEEGIVPHTDFNRYSARANIHAELTGRLSVGLSSTFSSLLRNQMVDAPFARALKLSPLAVPYDDEGNLLDLPETQEPQLLNPLLYFQQDQYINENKSYRIFASIYGQYKITEELTYRLNYGPDFSSSRNGMYTGSFAGSQNSGSISNLLDFDYTIENILTYDKTFGDHYLNVLGVFSTQKSRFESSGASGVGIPLGPSGFYGLGNASAISGLNSSVGEWGLLSYMGRINYGYKDRYLITATGRADGSSRLAEGNKWAFFPAVSLGWIASEENFMRVPWLSFLKLRAGYGEVGNTSINPYQTLGGLGRTVYAFGTSQAFGFGQEVIPNPDLKWEISKTLNVGLDFGFFEGRISGAFEYYDTRTDDLLLRRVIPITSGYSSILQNIGATRNRGWELNLMASLVNGGSSGFNWGVDVNIFSNKEEIVELFNGEDDDVGNRWFIGRPINVFYSFRKAGIWQDAEEDHAPGDIRIADINGRGPDGELTNQPDGAIDSDDRTVLGSIVPGWSGGITNRFSFKGFDLSVLVYARQGQMLRSLFHDLDANNWQGRYNSLDINYWTPDNFSDSWPRPYTSKTPLYADALNYFDGSFIKIKNISFGYELPDQLVNRLGLSSLRFYTTVNNAITFSEFDTVDPEVARGRVGINNPLTTATYIFGVNLKL